jgi:hypothetical protein
MHSKRWRIPLITLTAGLMFLGCAGRHGHWSAHYDQSVVLKTGRVTQDYQSIVGAGRPPVKLLIWVAGFYNKENPKELPKPIKYGYVDLPAVNDELVAYARGLSWVKSVEAVPVSDYSPELNNRTDKKRRIALISSLIGLHLFVINEAIPPHPERNLSSPVRLDSKWVTADRVLVILGYEIPRRREDPHTLTAVLGCFWYSGTGDYVAMSVEPYDFGDFRTANLVQLGRRCFPL